MTNWTVRADYDPEASWWYVSDSDVPGLSTGADSLAALEAKLPDMIVELIDLNEHLILDKDRLVGPHSYRLVAHDEGQRAITSELAN